MEKAAIIALLVGLLLMVATVLVGAFKVSVLLGLFVLGLAIVVVAAFVISLS